MDTPGRRRPDGTTWIDFEPGDYAFSPETGFWYFMTPNHESGQLDPTRWQVTSHEDQTVTVSPSIHIQAGNPLHTLWHGWLTHGIWSEAAS